MESPADSWLGTTLADRYRVVARMGAGGMGVVYRAWDVAGDRYVVIKTPRRELLADAKFLTRFEQELAALRALSHPSVVPIIDFGGEQGVPYATMPYLAGGSLKRRVRSPAGGTLAPEDPSSLWRWLPAIAQALDFVHGSGYVHRDVKPDNILFDGHGRSYLSDFGVAKTVLHAEDDGATRGLTGTGFALGTPDYMAPELISGVKPAPPIDQYALAVMTYEILSGRKPFDGPTPAAILIAHASGTAPPLAAFCPTLPRSAIAAIERGMHKDPVRRFDTCAAFAQALLADIARPSTPEKMQLICPQCDRLLNVKPDWAGRQGNCPRCKSALTIAQDLASLWIPTDRQEGASLSQVEQPARFGATPSRPVTIPRSPSVRGTPPAPSLPARTWQAFSSSTILQATAASVAAFALLAITIGPAMTTRQARSPMPRPSQITEAPPVDSEAEGEPPSAVAPRGEQADADSAPEPIAATPEPTPPAPVPAVPQQQDDGGPLAPMSALQSNADTAPAIAEPAAIPPLTPSDEVLPVPEADQIAAATELIRQAFADAYLAARQPGEETALINRLDATQAETRDPVRRYALLLEAERLAADAGDLSRSLSFVSTRREIFDIDSTAEKLQLISRFSKLAPDAAAPMFDDFIETAYAHLERDDYAVAEQLASNAVRLAKAISRERKMAAAQAKKKLQGRSMAKRLPLIKNKPASDGESLVDQAEALAQHVEEQKKRHEAYVVALETLRDAADDQLAHEAAGRFLCFMKDAWEDGLPHLAAGQDELLADLARRQMTAAGMTPSGVFAIAGEWWDAGEQASLSKMEADAAQAFASRLYRDVLRALSDPVEVALATKRASASGDGVGSESRTLGDLIDGAFRPAAVASGTSTVPARSPRGDAFAGRKSEDARKQRLAAHGGTLETEAAVDAALAWLLEHQMPDGGWTLDFPQCPACNGACSGPGAANHREDRCAATAMALLPFLGRGMSHRDGPYRKQLLGGIGFLAGLATSGNGKCYGRQGTLYSQGLAGIALAEAYGLTKDLKLKAPAQAAINFIMEAQDPQGGGWRYAPRQAGDTSVTGWQVTALKTAMAAGLTVNPLVVARANAFLDSVQEDNGKAYGYTDAGSGYATSAIGLLCRSYLGTRDSVPRYAEGVERIASRGPGSDMYLNYYATCLLREVGGTPWEPWNRSMQARLLETQRREGHESGSWFSSFSSGPSADVGGRLYVTAFATLILEAPYRCLENARP